MILKKIIRQRFKVLCEFNEMKVDPFKNMKHVDTKCHCCKSTLVRFDEHRGEIFCEKCGTVLHRISDVLKYNYNG